MAAECILPVHVSRLEVWFREEEEKNGGTYDEYPVVKIWREACVLGTEENDTVGCQCPA